MTKSNPILPYNLLQGATIDFYCLFDEPHLYP